jgi:hypothetical protein
MFEAVGDDDVHELAVWAVEIQRRHGDTVRRASLALARDEALELAV